MTGYGSRAEGSVSFSLNELMRLEEERVLHEREDARLRREAAQRSAEEAERTARAEADARARSEHLRRAEEERCAREEEARLEGIRRAVLLRERLVAEQGARDAEVLRLRQHELELVRLKQNGTRRMALCAGWAVAAMCFVSLVACVAIYTTHLKPAAERRLAQASAESALGNESIENAQRHLDQLRQRVGGLSQQLKTAEERATILEKQLRDLRAEHSRRNGTHPPPLLPTPTHVPKTGLIDGACRHPGDPLCAGT